MRQTTIIKLIKTYIVSNLSSTIRFNTYCEQNLEEFTSRKGVKKAISKGELRLNNDKTEGGRWLTNGDIITWVDLEQTPPKTYEKVMDVIFEDEDMAIIIKPAGISVSGNQFKTVQNALNYNLTPSNKRDKLPWPLPVHRLDNQTTGLLIIAKTKTARIQLGHDFEQKKITKQYHAVVIGKLEGAGKISNPIEGKNSSSLYSSIKLVKSLKNDWLSLIELSPLTGRTHQLRIHCSQLGHPILGDKLYGKDGMILKAKGLFLAAVKLEFNHPISKKPLEFKMPTPHKFIKRLENEERRFNSKTFLND